MNNDEIGDHLTSTLCLTGSVHILMMMLQSITDDITNALLDAIIVTPACEKLYLPHYISILFMGIIMGGRIRKSLI